MIAQQEISVVNTVSVSSKMIAALAFVAANFMVIAVLALVYFVF